MTPEAKLLNSYVWHPDPLVKMARDFFIANRVAAMHIKIGKWKSLFRVTQNADTFDQFHTSLDQHLHHKKPHKGPDERERWKDPNLTEQLMTAIGEAASFPGTQVQQVFLYIGQNRLALAERTVVEDNWRLAKARTFLTSLVRYVELEESEPARSEV